MTGELDLRLRSLRKCARVTQSELVKLVEPPTDRPDKEQARKLAALRSRGEPSVPAQHALDGLGRPAPAQVISAGESEHTRLGRVRRVD